MATAERPVAWYWRVFGRGSQRHSRRGAKEGSGKEGRGLYCSCLQPLGAPPQREAGCRAWQEQKQSGGGAWGHRPAPAPLLPAAQPAARHWGDGGGRWCCSHAVSQPAKAAAAAAAGALQALQGWCCAAASQPAQWGVDARWLAGCEVGAGCCRRARPAVIGLLPHALYCALRMLR